MNQIIFGDLAFFEVLDHLWFGVQQRLKIWDVHRSVMDPFIVNWQIFGA